jgi:hypothetical protein
LKITFINSSPSLLLVSAPCRQAQELKTRW